MNLYFRLFLFLLSLPFIKKVTSQNKIDFTHQSELLLRVWPNDLDIFNHMNNGRYLSIMDFGRFHLMAQFGTIKKAYQKSWSPAVGSIKINYIRSLKLFDKYKLTTQLVCWDAKWLYVEQQFIKIDKKNNRELLMATALIKLLFVKKSQKISSQELVNGFFTKGVESPEMPEKVRKWVEAESKNKDPHPNPLPQAEEGIE
jgi:acyl-CoA thioesterase FadM